MESSLKNFAKKNVRDILFYPSLPDVINRDIFTTPPHSFKSYVIHGSPLNKVNTVEKTILPLNKLQGRLFLHDVDVSVYVMVQNE